MRRGVLLAAAGAQLAGGTEAPAQLPGWYQSGALLDGRLLQYERAGLFDRGQEMTDDSRASDESSCTLDHYTSALELCEVVARRQPLDLLWSSTGELVREAAPRVMTAGDAPDLMMEEMLHPLWKSPSSNRKGSVATRGRIDDDEECKEDWIYRSAEQHGCYVEPSGLLLPGSSRSWCVVQAGTSNAHFGSWGAWKYCNWVDRNALAPNNGTGPEIKQAKVEHTVTTALNRGRRWALEPQASFASAEAPGFDRLCSASDTCGMAIDALLHRRAHPPPELNF